jgi:hypothetical protein
VGCGWGVFWYVAGFLNQVNEINFYVPFNEPLKYSEYTEACISGRECTISFTDFGGIYFKLYDSSGENIVITF